MKLFLKLNDKFSRDRVGRGRVKMKVDFWRTKIYETFSIHQNHT